MTNWQIKLHFLSKPQHTGGRACNPHADERAQGLGGLGGVDGDAAQAQEEVKVHVHAVHVTKGARVRV